MIGARKSFAALTAEDLAFYYDEMVRCHLTELEVQTEGGGKIILKRLSRGSHPLRRKTDVLGEGGHEGFVSHPASVGSAPAPAAPAANIKTINSPIIGVFYRAFDMEAGRYRCSRGHFTTADQLVNSPTGVKIGTACVSFAPTCATCREAPRG